MFYLTFFFILGNVPPRSGGSSKYLRGHLFAAASTIAAAAGGSAGCGQSASAASVGSSAPTTSQRPNTSKVRVLSILDKIRSSTQENYPCNQRPNSMTTPAQTIQNEALIDAISLVEDNGYVKYIGSLEMCFFLCNLTLTRFEGFLELWYMCDNYVPQWWVEFYDELSWLFTKRYRAFYLICRK